MPRRDRNTDRPTKAARRRRWTTSSRRAKAHRARLNRALGRHGS